MVARFYQDLISKTSRADYELIQTFEEIIFLERLPFFVGFDKDRNRSIENLYEIESPDLLRTVSGLFFLSLVLHPDGARASRTPRIHFMS